MNGTDNQPQINKLNGKCYDVIVIGGGMVGAVMACALASQGLKVAVVEDWELCIAGQQPKKISPLP